ncbi:hypothetical protein HZH66_003927 [Vespula vulgaris]|uniref:Uncharacterized protein n=1 Tax=Vespula vulgaris TaxID=7454 RepID=A0A834KDZ9_VESVU|nr:hypothetical protein HZH66_003927 [Vespula vulgaris]
MPLLPPPLSPLPPPPPPSPSASLASGKEIAGGKPVSSRFRESYTVNEFESVRRNDFRIFHKVSSSVSVKLVRTRMANVQEIECIVFHEKDDGYVVAAVAAATVPGCCCS